MPSSSHVILHDRYRLAAKIGAGGFGDVWRAHDLVLDRPVAIKLLRDDCGADAETLARFRAEARHAGALAHENIARIYDYGDPALPNPAYLVMEVVDGRSLAQELRGGGAIEVARCMDITAQAAAGLEVAHRAGVVHRDIKPGNLLLAWSGVVKITDFGISHAVGSAPLTRAGAIVGTPGYLAPERASGAQASPSSDLYALGVVAYECLTGAPPFAGTPLEVALAHCQQPFPAVPDSVPQAVAHLVREMTAKDPADRPASAADVASRARDLRDRLGADPAAQARAAPRLAAYPGYSDGPELAMTRLLPRQAATRPSRSRLALGAGAAALAAGLVGVALSGVLGATSPGAGSVPHSNSSPAGSPRGYQLAKHGHHSGHGHGHDHRNGHGHGDGSNQGDTTGGQGGD